MTQDEIWDVAVIGAGSAGMAAAIYAARFGLKTVVVGQVVGGLLNDSHNVENYPGFKSIPGFDLMMKFKEHCENLAIPFHETWVTRAERTQGEDTKRTIFTLHARDQLGKESVIRARTVILTMGTKHRKLGAKNEEALAGKGVSYCATCDAAFYRNVPVAIVGGGDSAAQAGQLVSQFASHVYLIVRKDKMRAEPINIARLEQNPKVTIIYGTNVAEVLGDDEITGLRLTTPFHGSDILPVKGMFVEIGHDIQSELAVQLGVAVDGHGQIIIDGESKTNIEGVYAAGDVGNRRYKQALTGAAEGAIAAFSAYERLQRIDNDTGVDISY